MSGLYMINIKRNDTHADNSKSILSIGETMAFFYCLRHKRLFRHDFRLIPTRTHYFRHSAFMELFEGTVSLILNFAVVNVYWGEFILVCVNMGIYKCVFCYRLFRM